MATPITFRIFRGDTRLREQTVERAAIHIGRSPNADLKLEDKKVSRKHCRVDVGAQGATLVDLGSTAGTWLNGQRVQQALLRSGDVITLGDTRIEVGVGGGITPEPPEPPEDSISKTSPAVPLPETRSAPQSAPQPAPPPARAAAPAPAPRKHKQQRPAPAPAHARPAAAPPTAAEPVPPADRRALQVRAFWRGTLIELRNFTPRAGKRTRVLVGTGVDVDFLAAPDPLPTESFPIVEEIDGHWSLNVVPGMDGEIEAAQVRQGLREAVAGKRSARHPELENTQSIDLPPDARVRVEVEGLTLVMRFVAPPRAAATRPGRPDYTWLNVFLLSVFMHACFLAAAVLFPFDSRSFAEDLLSRDNRFAKLILEPPEKRDKSFLQRLKKDLNVKKGGEKAKEAEGKLGRKEVQTKEPKKAGTKAIDPKDKEIAASTGILKLLNKGGSEGLERLFSGSGLGGEIVNALGGIQGGTYGDTGGLGGLGLRGGGFGGGGTGRSIDIAGLATEGRGGGGSGRYGDGAAGLGEKEEKDIKVASGRPVVMGALDPALIKKVIQRYKNQIRYCYERELSRSPNLGGKISIKFIIAGTGRVSSAEVAETTMKNAEVEDCVVRRVKSWLFPQPKGGGIVIVTYPFVFKTSG